MLLNEARQILGLGPDEDPRLHLREFRIVRERLAAMVRDAPNEALAERYQTGLQDMDRALAAVREYLEALGLKVPPAEPVADPAAAPPVVREPHPEPSAAEEPEDAENTARQPRRGLRWLGIAALLAVLGGGGWIYLKWQDEQQLAMQVRLMKLEAEAVNHVAERRWPEAGAAYDQIEKLNPGSPVVGPGRRSIQAGMAEEAEQFGGYWLGQAREALDGGRLDEASAALAKLLERFPKDGDALALAGEISAARSVQARKTMLAAAREALTRRDWAAAAKAARGVLDAAPGDADAGAVLEEATAALAKAEADRAKARTLFQRAAARYQGEFDQQSLDWLREAALLAPGDAEISALLGKIMAHHRMLKVPGDYPTPAEALAHARAGDRLNLGEGEWRGPLAVPAGVEIEGAGDGKTVIGCGATEGCVMSFGPSPNASRVSNLTLRHDSQSGDDKRYSLALVRGAEVEWVGCGFERGCGHGLAVIDGGKAKVLRGRFGDNGWDGAAASGSGSSLEISESSASGNFEHGIEVWDGAALTATANRCESNGRNGIHADTTAAVRLDDNRLTGNHEFGIVVTRAGSGAVRNNSAVSNRMGGIAVRQACAAEVKGNRLQRNEGPGLVLERGLKAEPFSGNTASENTGGGILTGLSYGPEKP